MKIDKVRCGLLAIPLRKPFKTALRTVTEVEEVIVAIETDDGHTGFSEAPPTARITGDTTASITAAIKELIAPALIGRDPRELTACLRASNNALVGNTNAKAAIDIALHDLWGKLLGQPVFKLFGGSRQTIHTDMTISVDDPDIMAADAADAVAKGYQTLKIKVGVDGERDISRLVAISSAIGTSVTIRLDANQGWTAGEAVRTLRRLEDMDFAIEFCEQPVAAGDIDGLRYVRERVAIPIMADESVHGPEDALELLRRGAADLLNIKLMKTGGLYRARQICALAEVFGVECMVGCMLEAKASTAAAVHLAAAAPIITKIDLDGPLLFDEDPMTGGPSFIGPEIELSDGPGFGISAIENVRWL